MKKRRVALAAGACAAAGLGGALALSPASAQTSANTLAAAPTKAQIELFVTSETNDQGQLPQDETQEKYFTQKHTGAVIPATDFAFTAEVARAPGSGAGAGRVKSNTFTVSRRPDSGTPRLFQSLLAGGEYHEISVLVRHGAKRVRFDFTICRLVKQEFASTADSDLSEVDTFAYGAVALRYVRPNGAKPTNGDQALGWNDVTSTATS